MRTDGGRVRKFGFNMIEIALALAILSIGISSVMVLFPVGVNAKKTAVAENNLADIAEYVLGYMQAGISSGWTTDGYNKVFDIPASYPSSSVEYADFDVAANEGERVIRKNDGVYLFRQLSQDKDGKDIEDFSMIAQVWFGDFGESDSDSGKKTVWYPRPYDASERGFGKIESATSNTNKYKNFAKALCLELSWPTDVPYADREKRYFRLEVFNDKFAKALETE